MYIVSINFIILTINVFSGGTCPPKSKKKLRCRIEKVKNNYKSSYKNNLECLFCKSENSIDSVQHYLESCSYFKQKDHFHKKIKGVKYEHIFNGSFEEQVRVVRIWLKIQEHRKLVDLT